MALRVWNTNCSGPASQCQAEQRTPSQRLPRDSSPLMAHRTASASLDADNNAGSSPAVCNDWHRGVADFHLGTGHTVPTSDAGYTTASELLAANHRSVSTCGGSPYTAC
jgi:hypothetical protein